MNYSQITENDLQIINGSILRFYLTISRDFCKTDNKMAKKQQRRFLKNESFSIEELSDECQAYFSKDIEPIQFFEFLEGCKKEFEQRIEAKKKSFFTEFSDLEDRTVESLWQIIERGSVDFAKRENKYELVLDDTGSYMLSLTVENLEIPDNYNSETQYIEVIKLSRNGGRFCLRCKFEDYENDSEGEFEFYFTNPQEKIVVFNDSEVQYEPWDALSFLANEIVGKFEVSPALCNDAEIKLIPLLKEIATLDCIPNEHDPLAFPLLKGLAIKHGYTKIADKLRLLENTPITSYLKSSSLRTTLGIMNKAHYEPLWREIYNKVADSQKEYPKQSDSFTNQKKLQKLRKELEIRFLSEGYSGKYPDFHKTGSMKGIHLANSYGMSYFVGLKKKVQYYIHCFENVYEEDISITFVSGTDLTKKNQCADIYSYMFNDNGKRLYNTTVYSSSADDLALSVSTAIKRAECKPLNKYEKQQEYGSALPAIIEFIFCFILAGGLFSVGFNLIFYPFMWGIEWLFGVRENFGEFMSHIPWLFSILFTWIGFGGVFGLVEMLSKRK